MNTGNVHLIVACTRYFRLNQNSSAILINTVNSKNIFSKIDTDSRDKAGKSGK